jgi:hypothetical protein
MNGRNADERLFPRARARAFSRKQAPRIAHL